MLRHIHSCLALLFLFFLPSFAYTLKVQTSPTRFPAPGDTITFEVIKDEGDVTVIDIILVSTASNGNLTTLFSGQSMYTSPNNTFEVPMNTPSGLYLLRFVDNSNKKFIIDSNSFQIFPPGTNSTSTTRSLLLTSSSTVSSTATNLISTSSSQGKKSNIGPIVGGAVGGFVVIAVIALLLLFWRRRKQKQAQDQDTGNEKTIPLSRTLKISEAERVHPFTIAPRPTFPEIYKPYNPHNDPEISLSVPESSITLSSGGTAAVSSGKGGYLGDVYRPSLHTVDSLSESMLQSSEGNAGGNPTARADNLRRERERISREIVALEHPASTTGINSLPTSSGLSTLTLGDSASAMGGMEISAQLLRLQEQIRQIEARQALGGVGEDFSIPPPMYDGPPASVFPVPQTLDVEQSIDVDQPANVGVGRRALPNPNPNLTPTTSAEVKIPIP